MFPRWWRLGIRPQLTAIVILGAILSTIATLIIADNAINNFVLGQANSQEQQNMKIATLVLQTQYGQNISVSSDNRLVVDQPGAGKDVTIDATNNFGRYVLNDNIDYVDQVQQLIGGSVSLYQCSNSRGDFTPCNRIATTFVKPGSGAGATNLREIGVGLPSTINSNMALDSGQPHEWRGIDTIDNRDYYAEYAPLFNPQQQLVGVLFVGVPLDNITSVVSRTTVELVLIGGIIMVAGMIFALFFTNSIINTLQRAARQVNGASERIGGIAAQQANGSAQQVWAINAINQALQNFSETARDISQRTDQLALMGNQVLQRRGEISPTQIDSILAYITRSVRDISVASRQQASQYERMTGAMQAVIEIAEQVAGNSQQSSESSERLELVVRQLQQLVGVRLSGRRTTVNALGMSGIEEAEAMQAGTRSRGIRSTIRAVRPAQRNGSMTQMDAESNAQMQMFAGADNASMGPMGRMQMSNMAPMGQADNSGGRMAGMPGMAGVDGRMQMANMMPSPEAQRFGPPALSANGPMGGQMGGMPGRGDTGAVAGRRGMNDMSGMTGAEGMRGGMARGRAELAAGQPPMDWRLPPMPEMPPMPSMPNMTGWNNGQRNGSDNPADGEHSPFGASGRGGQSGQPGSGRSGAPNTHAGGNGFEGGMPGQNGGYPRSRG